MKINEDISSLAFTPKDMEKGLLNKFVNSLLEINKELEHPIQIRITNDGFCQIVEYSDCCDSKSPFKYVGEDEFVISKKDFQDCIKKAQNDAIEEYVDYGGIKK